jgi:hypothetical protein
MEGTKAKRRFSTTKPDLVADDRADADSERAPEGDSRQRAEEEEGGLVEVEGVVDPASGQRRIADRETESFADQAEGDPGEQAGGELGRDDARPPGCEEEGGADRAEAVFARHEHDPRERGEDPGEAADAEQTALILGARQARCVREEPGQE